MHILLIIIESVGSVVGSVTAAILLCWLLWTIFRLARHPAWGPPIIVAPVALWALGRLPSSEFLHMTLAFALLAAIPFWAEGRAWRSDWIARHADRQDPATE